MATRLVLKSKHQLAPGVWEFVFTPDNPVAYTAGQYAHIRLPERPGERARAFSLISCPSEADIRFITRLDPPLSLYKDVLAAMEPGDIAEIDEPLGDCILPRLASTPLIFLAQGIAIASYLAILHELRERLDLAHTRKQGLTNNSCARSNLSQLEEWEGKILLVWIRRSEDDTLEKLIPSEIRNFQRVDLHYPKRLTTEAILRHVSDKTLIYLSGSQQFVESLGAEIETAGHPRARLIYDYYDGYSEL